MVWPLCGKSLPVVGINRMNLGWQAAFAFDPVLQLRHLNCDFLRLQSPLTDEIRLQSTSKDFSSFFTGTIYGHY